MSQADIQYNKVVEEISNGGYCDKGQNVRTKYADGTPAYTKSLIGVQFRFDGKEVPILTTKKLAWKTAIKEMMLFWIHQTVKKEDFHKWNVKIWDEWFLEDQTLGKSYAYQFESRPKREVVKIKRRIKNKHGKLKPFKVSELLEHNPNCKDEICGEIFESKSFGKFKVLDVYDGSKDYHYIKFCDIQFLETGYIKRVQKQQIIHNREIRDPYARNVCGVGYIGEYEHIKNISQEHVQILHKKWIGMMERCYNKNSVTYRNHGGKGVFVDERWHCFANFLEDVRYLPQYFIAKAENFKGWSIDKDYFGSNCYSKETCVWLHKKENAIYQKRSYPILLISPNGEEKIFINQAEIVKEGILSESSINKLCSRKVDTVKGYKAKFIINDEYVYRYKISKNQVVELIDNIKNNPSSRRLMTSFWNYTDIESKALQECAFQTQWFVQDDKLHLILTQRSGDVGLGVPFNQFQYFVLQNMLAHICELEVGEFIHNIGSCHIYDRHEDVLLKQIKQKQYPAPKLWLNPNVKDFFDFTPNDIRLIDYKHGDVFKMEVAI